MTEVNKIPTPFEHLSFPNQKDFYCSAFSLIFMANFSLNLLSSMQNMPTDLHANISAIYISILLGVVGGMKIVLISN